jgi:hypothetical protein
MAKVIWRGFVPDSDPRYSEGVTVVVGRALNAPTREPARQKESTPKPAPQDKRPQKK